MCFLANFVWNGINGLIFRSYYMPLWANNKQHENSKADKLIIIFHFKQVRLNKMKNKVEWSQWNLLKAL